MPVFSFEVLRTDGSIVAGDERDLPSSTEAWGHLEVLAIQLRHRSDVSLRVKDQNGAVIILTGLATPIASIEMCSKTDCPIKDLLAGYTGERLDACAPCMSIFVSEIPLLDLPDLLSHPPTR